VRLRLVRGLPELKPVRSARARATTIVATIVTIVTISISGGGQLQKHLLPDLADDGRRRANA
jgi:hypothetical protein